jgi:glucose-6-phosphate dehydrogenase assembly protein OpcA
MTGRMTVVASWRSTEVEIHELGSVVRALANHTEALSRTAVLTLIGVTSSADATDRARSAIGKLAERHPLHALIAQETASGAGPYVSASARCHQDSAGAAGVCLTDVVVECSPAAVQTLVEQVRLPGLTAMAWYVDRLPDPSETLPTMVDVVLLDTCAATPAQIASILALADRAYLVDLNWLRLRPWRQLFAGLFATDSAAGFLSGVDHVRIGGAHSCRALLAGWLATRLNLPRARIDTVAAAAPSIRLQARHGGTAAVFTVEPAENPVEIFTEAAVHNGPSHRRRLPAPRWTLIDQLDLAITRPDPEPDTYRQVLATSADLGLWTADP